MSAHLLLYTLVPASDVCDPGASVCPAQTGVCEPAGCSRRQKNPESHTTPQSTHNPVSHSAGPVLDFTLGSRVELP
eukprot:2113935-Prymnesium_polylepis.1